MNRVLSLFIGPHSQKLSYFLYHLEAEQIYDEEDDPMDHKVIWKNVEQRIPRALIYDFKNSITALEHINNSNNSKVLRKLEQQSVALTLNYTDLQGQINQSLGGIKQGPRESADTNPLIKVFNNFSPLKGQCIEVNKYHADPQWVMYYSGLGIADTPEKAEVYTDPFRRQLEEEDYLDGFVVWADTFNGYGVFTQKMIDFIKDDCPKKPILLSCLSDSDETEKYSSKQMDFYSMNQFLVYGQLRPKVDIFLPFNIRPQLDYFISHDQFNVYRSIAPLASQIYSSFSNKNSIRFSNYVQNMRPFAWNNLFNAAYTLPLIQQDAPTRGYRITDYANIGEKNNLNYLRSMQLSQPKQKKYESFSESYVLRGSIDLKQFQPQTHGFDMKVTDNLFAQREDQQVQFVTHYSKYYGEEACSFPFHSVVFSHELLKSDLKQIIQSTESCSSSVMSSYMKLGFERDNMKQLKQSLMELYDNYDRNGRQSDSDPDQ